MSSVSPPLSPGDVVAQKYEIELALGGGPVGRTYLARLQGGGKRVVIKLINGPGADAAAVARVIAKVQSVKSDALVEVLDHGNHRGSTFVVMEYFEAESLRRLMDEYAGQRKPFSLPESAQIIARALEAVDAAHRAGLIHRHLKPQNILVASKQVGPGQGKVVRTIKITGLGLSELCAPAVLNEGITDRPEARYLAPELSVPSAGGSPQADIYSAGVIFYELLTGQTPRGTYLSPSQVREDLPENVDAIVDIALAANAEDRFPTVRDMINNIQRTFTEDGPKETSLPKRTIAMVVGGVLALAAAALVGVFVMDPARGARVQDETLRAEVVKENPAPAADLVKQKLAGHEDMVFVPEGTFIRGRMRAEDSNTAAATEPMAEKTKTGGFLIDRFEWPNKNGDHAQVRVTVAEAETLCASVGKRLCTADEWERACKGPENLIYTYGDSYDAAKCGGDVPADGDRDDHLDAASGALAGCTNPYGVFDMSGGAREWTSAPDPSNAKFRVVKGGKKGMPERGTRCAYGEGANPTNADRALGFRCCLGDGETISPTGATPAAPAAPATP